MSVLDNELVRDHFRQAWKDSCPGTSEAHEEGGFVLKDSEGLFTVVRWPRGSQIAMIVPPHPGGVRDSSRIVATFHTHPNPAPQFQQEPSLTDIRAVREDEDLHYPDYEGEYVISQEALYRIHPDGSVEDLGSTKALLKSS